MEGVLMNDEPMLTVSSSSGRKVTDGDYGSFDKNYHISVRLPMLELDDEVLQKIDSILELIDKKLEARIAHRMREWMGAAQDAPEPVKPPQTPSPAPRTAPAPPSPPQTQANTTRMNVSAFRVKNHQDKDMKIVFALGTADSSLAYKGNWEKFGVLAYPETYRAFFDPERYGLGDHQPGAPVYADVYLKEDGKTPDKVARFLNQHGVAYEVIRADDE